MSTRKKETINNETRSQKRRKLRDWSLLVPDIVFSISEKITYIVDFIRFRAVCTNWRSALPRIPRHLPTQIPWLMLPFNPHGGELNEDFLVSFYNPVESKIHELNLPELRDRYICGVSHGWFILEKGRDYSLLNPITREQVSLPSLYVKYNWNPENEFLEQEISDYTRVRKACLSCQPSLGSECIVSALMYGNWAIAICRVGDQCWTVLDVNEIEKGKLKWNDDIWFADINYHNGLLYCITNSLQVTLVDVQKPCRKLVTSPATYDQFCLVQRELPVPFLVTRLSRNFVPRDYYDAWGNDERDIWLSMYELNYNYALLGDKMLFLDSRFQCIGVSCDKLQLDGWTGVHCWLVSRKLSPQSRECYSCSIKVVERKRGLFRCADEKVVERNLGSFRWYWQEYLWITPSLF